MIRALWWLRARVTYLLARRLIRWDKFSRNPRCWQWSEGQFSRMANLGDTGAQGFYGHMLMFRGQGLGAREEGVRLLRLAALGGSGTSAYQLGVMSLEGTPRTGPDAAEAARWWEIAVKAGHPLAIMKLEQLYLSGGPGLKADRIRANELRSMSKF
ncbi:MAG: tetratricopeptide repeat protein [Pseudomonas sp.]